MTDPGSAPDPQARHETPVELAERIGDAYGLVLLLSSSRSS